MTLSPTVWLRSTRPRSHRRVKRVLIVYPEGDSPHALRIVRPLARHLPALGWEPVLLTADGAGVDLPLERIVVRARELPRLAIGGRAGSAPFAGRASLALRAKSAVGRTIAIPDRYNLWALKAARAAGRLRGFDAVLTSGPPHSAHFVGRTLARKGVLPWVADMRDPWTTNGYTIYNRLTRTLDTVCERRVLASATAIVTVSEEIAAQVATVHGRQVDVIENTYDEDEFPGWDPPVFDPFVMTYAGSLIGGRRDPRPVLQAIALLRKRRPDLAIRSLWVTDMPGLVTRVAEEERVGEVVESLGWKDRREVLALWRASSVLLLLKWDDPYDAGVPTGKLYEYIGAGRPILCMGGPQGAVARTLATTGIGVHARNPGEAADFLERLVSGPWSPHTTANAAYSAAAMAASFARLLEE